MNSKYALLAFLLLNVTPAIAQKISIIETKTETLIDLSHVSEEERSFINQIILQAIEDSNLHEIKHIDLKSIDKKLEKLKATGAM